MIIPSLLTKWQPIYAEFFPCAGRSLLEDEVKSMVVALLYEAEHAEQAAQRGAALSCLKVGT